MHPGQMTRTSRNVGFAGWSRVSRRQRFSAGFTMAGATPGGDGSTAPLAWQGTIGAYLRRYEVFPFAGEPR